MTCPVCGGDGKMGYMSNGIVDIDICAACKGTGETPEPIHPPEARGHYERE